MDCNQISRPEKVGAAVKLLYSTLALGILRSILEASTHIPLVSPAFMLLFTVFALGIMSLLIHNIGKGRNWARISVLGLFLAGVPFSILPLLHSLAENPISGLLGVGQVILQIVALVLLFQKPSSDWFREMKAPAAAQP